MFKFLGIIVSIILSLTHENSIENLSNSRKQVREKDVRIKFIYQIYITIGPNRDDDDRKIIAAIKCNKKCNAMCGELHPDRIKLTPKIDPLWNDWTTRNRSLLDLKSHSQRAVRVMVSRAIKRVITIKIYWTMFLTLHAMNARTICFLAR